MRTLRHLSLVLLILMSGAGPLWGWEDPWVNTGGKHSPESGEYQVDLPSGWKRVGNLSDTVQVTKDGLALQEILITKRSVKDALPNTKKTLSANMLSHEVAQVLVDDLMSNTNVTNQIIQENGPEPLANHPGFHLVYSFKTKSGLAKKVVYYGFLVGDWLFALRYEAAAKYYFARDLPAFEKVKESFQFVNSSSR